MMMIIIMTIILLLIIAVSVLGVVRPWADAAQGAVHGGRAQGG